MSLQLVFPQEDDGVVALDLPIRNSLVFNRYVINPTFSFVREQHKYFSINLFYNIIKNSIRLIPINLIDENRSFLIQSTLHFYIISILPKT